MPRVERQHHIGAAQQKKSCVRRRKLAQGVNGIALSAAPLLCIADDDSFDSAEGKLAHTQPVCRIVNKVEPLVRRQKCRDHIKIVEPHLRKERPCGCHMPVVRRCERTAVNTDAPHPEGIGNGHFSVHSSSIVLRVADSR